MEENGKPKPTIAERWQKLYNRCLALWEYCSSGVWEDVRSNFRVNTIKTVNLTVRTFMSTDLQSKACAMTYRTLLAIVPALALLFAIGRGFDLQNLLQKELYGYFPSQSKALDMAFSFVDSCLAQASEGIFVGVGIVFLLWTIISLLINVEDTFNEIWGITNGRSIFRKVTDYLAICIILPILMTCSGGIQIFMSNTIQKLLPFDTITPIVSWMLDCMSYVFGWLFFVGVYMLIPNTKVHFKNALLAGVLAGTAFQVLQWLFITGQLYVAKYNAIYGSFSFLPLMLIWMQLSWLITLAGALICCSSQNIFLFSYEKQIDGISSNYRRKVTLAVLTVITHRFKHEMEAVNIDQLCHICIIPPKLVRNITHYLLECGLINKIVPRDEHEIEDDLPLQPSMDLSFYTIGNVLNRLASHGMTDFIPEFNENFSELNALCDKITSQIATSNQNTLLADISFNIQETQILK
ncbi:MAG: YihY/virulence factor BrkB family protein [Muribaculaceae bacterium]|nr:YihY/virulence factor BrkB family protein [Muribaculaceae bacterium]